MCWKYLKRLMSAVSTPNGIEVDNIYYARDFAQMFEMNIPAPTLTALVNRGLLYCDGKMGGKNVYAITEEIYDYYNKPGLDKHEERMNRMANKFLAMSVEGNKQSSDRAYAIRQIKEATTIEEKQYWIGVRDAIGLLAPTEWKYDGEVMPEEEKFDW